MRSGLIPPLARGFSVRHESMPNLEDALLPGKAVLLAPAQAAKVPDWHTTTGKTQMAAYAAQSLRWTPGGLDLVAWVTAASRATVLSGYAEAASRLGLDQTGDGEAVAARFAAWLRSTPRPWLVVLDELLDPTDLEGLWPAGPAGRLLITAASPEAARDVPLLSVGYLTPREAVSYLSERLSTDPGHRGGQLDLALELGGEPAALAHAGAVIETSELTCRDYQEIFQCQRAELERSGTGPVAAGAVTWRLSACHAEILDPGGATWPMLVLVALLCGHGVPLTVLTDPAVCRYLGGDVPQGGELARSAIQALSRAGLLDIDQTGASAIARVSGALRTSVLAVIPPELLKQSAGTAADALVQVWPKDPPETRLAALLRSCAASLLDAAGDALWSTGRCHRVLVKAGQSLDAARLPGPAVAWWQQLTQGSARVLGERHTDTVVAAGLLADALLAAGQVDDAVTWFEWILAARTETLGPDHRGTIAARIGLGRALTAVGRVQDAITVLDESALLSDRACGPDDEATLSATEAHAAACLAAGQPREAARLLMRALAGREKTQGSEAAATLATGDRLAAAYLAAGKFREGTTQYKKLLACSERTLGPDHPDTLNVRASLAAAYDTAGRIGDALREHQQACAGCERTFGPDHPLTLSRRAGLALAYYAAGQIGDALAVLRDSTARAERALSPADPVTRRLRQAQAGITAELAGE